MMPAQPLTPRTRAEVAELAAGLEQVAPGLVPINEWRPDPDDLQFDHVVPLHALVARKP